MSMAVTINGRTLELPKKYEELVTEYFRLVRRSTLSDRDFDRMSEIWEQAEKDEKLSHWLETVDFILGDDFDDSNLQCKIEQEKDKAEKDEDLQYFLSEHIEVLTTQKIKERDSKKNSSNSQDAPDFQCESELKKDKEAEETEAKYILCPDGKGYKMLTFDDGENGETIEQWSKQKCFQCGHPYSEHFKFAPDKQNKTEVSET